MSVYDYDIPSATREMINNWVTKGWKPGSFGWAVLCNNLKDACAAADEYNQNCLFHIVGYLYNECPSACWGSREKAEAWHENFQPHPPKVQP